jgi:hypothetical protein
MMSSTIIPIQKKGARSRTLETRPQSKGIQAMMREVYDPGSTTLLLAVFHLRDLARIEFLYGNSVEGIFLSQLALDLLKIAYGGALDCTAVWRALAAQHPTFFAGVCRPHTLGELRK